MCVPYISTILFTILHTGVYTTCVFDLLQILFGFLQLGFITTFLSEPLVSGYTTGAAVHVFTSQLRHLVGVPSADVKVDPGVFSLQRVCHCLCLTVCPCIHVLCIGMLHRHTYISGYVGARFLG